MFGDVLAVLIDTSAPSLSRSVSSDFSDRTGEYGSMLEVANILGEPRDFAGGEVVLAISV